MLYILFSSLRFCNGLVALPAFCNSVDVLPSHQRFRRGARKRDAQLSITIFKQSARIIAQRREWRSKASLPYNIKCTIASQDQERVCAAVETLRASLYQLSRGQVVDLVGIGNLRLPADHQLHSVAVADCGKAR